MSKHVSKLFAAALVLLVLQGMGAMAAEPAAPEGFSAADLNVDWGGDIRIRNVHFSDIPIIADPPGVTRGDINHFWRFRTRLWGSANLTENISVKGRIVNESRLYHQPTDQSSWDSLDEIIVDQLYVDFNNLLGVVLANASHLRGLQELDANVLAPDLKGLASPLALRVGN